MGATLAAPARLATQVEELEAMESTRPTVRAVRRHNRHAVLSRLFFDGPLSRQNLTRLTGLSTGTVSTVTGELIAEGMVVEAGLVESDGGRPRTLLRVDPGYGHVVGVDVGETRIRVDLFDLGMSLCSRVDYSLESVAGGAGPGTVDTEPASVVDRIVAGLRQVEQQSGVAAERILGIGVGLFGIVEQTRDLLVHAQTVGWAGVPVGRMLLERGVSQPVFIANGAKALAQAEMWFGAGRGSRRVAVALVGYGVGGALIEHQSTLQDATSSATEWGHTVVRHEGDRCRCGARGCLEAYIGAEGVLARYQRAGGTLPSELPNEEAAFEWLLEQADKPGTASDVIRETVGYLGAGLANLVNLFSPERIVLGGWAGLALGKRLLPAIREATAACALRNLMDRTSLELCQIGPEAVALGAATLPVAELLSCGRGSARRRESLLA